VASGKSRFLRGPKFLKRKIEQQVVDDLQRPGDKERSAD
jgi:hypothetical protein